MLVSRNPFRIRASEKIIPNETFLRLFATGVLDLVQRDGVWDRLQIFRSAPGGGKTSLFRIFSPSALNTLYDLRNGQEYKILYQKLKGLDVIAEEGPKLLGIPFSCTSNIGNLEDLDLKEMQKIRLFYATLNSRITVAALRSALELKKLTYPNDLSKLQILRPSGRDIPTSVPAPCSGTELHNWAASIEGSISKTLDSFSSSYGDSLVGHDTISCLHFLQANCICIDGKPVANHTLLMLDDVHKLTSTQRKNLSEALSILRLPIGVWLAERLEALRTEELLAYGATSEREYDEPIILEDYWRGGANYKHFENFVLDIANRRAMWNPNYQAGDFDACLPTYLDTNELNEKFSEAFRTIYERLRKRNESIRKYDNWMKLREVTDVDNPRERATNLRRLEIIIERDLYKRQETLFENEPLPESELDARDLPPVKSAAEFFLAQEFNFPYYFGFSRLADLASSNVDQFLSLGGDLFEEIISAQMLKQSSIITPYRQEEILKKKAKQVWDRIARSVSEREYVIKFLDSIRQFCVWMTNQPNAPYAPGVTGIAISMDSRERLRHPEERKNPRYDKLARIITTCISNNLLEASLDRHQGQKGGKTYMIMYLNRLLCLQFGLPLQYGGWKEHSLNQLCEYFEGGFKSFYKKSGRIKR